MTEWRCKRTPKCATPLQTMACPPAARNGRRILYRRYSRCYFTHVVSSRWPLHSPAAHVSPRPDMRAAASRFSASARCLSRAGGFARPIATSGSVRASDGADVVSPSPVVDPRCASTTRLDGPRRSARTTAARRWSARRFCSDGRPPFSGDALPTTTRAVVFDAHGHPSRALRVDEAFPVAPLGPEDVLVRFAASPVNPSDANVVEGTYPLRPRAFPAVGGGEGVAEVVRFGARVDRRSLVGGDDLDAFAEEDVARKPVKVVPDVPGSGTWREFAVFPAAALRRVPARLPDELAAQMCVNLPTALRLLQDFADLGADFEADFEPRDSPGSFTKKKKNKRTKKDCRFERADERRRPRRRPDVRGARRPGGVRAARARDGRRLGTGRAVPEVAGRVPGGAGRRRGVQDARRRRRVERNAARRAGSERRRRRVLGGARRRARRERRDGDVRGHGARARARAYRRCDFQKRHRERVLAHAVERGGALGGTRH